MKNLPENIFSKVLVLARVSRQKTITQYVGHSPMMQPGSELLEAINAQKLPSLVLYGPSGIGKTTMARLLAQKTGYRAAEIVFCGIGQLHGKHNETFDEMFNRALDEFKATGTPTALILDEIHRSTYHQQLKVVQAIDDGAIGVIGTTVFEPAKYLIPSLVTRLKRVPLFSHSEEDLRTILHQTLKDKQHGLGDIDVRIDPDAEDLLCRSSDGCAKILLRFLEKEVLRQLLTSAPDGNSRDTPFVCHIARSHIESLVEQRLKRKKVQQELKQKKYESIGHQHVSG